ncbi:MAG TPA: hypothetical protein VMF55_09055 [Solirubrobacterales bacterium]|nr:hypothetical protein [Solirubrobacterales bacterium]
MSVQQSCRSATVFVLGLAVVLCAIGGLVGCGSSSSGSTPTAASTPSKAFIRQARKNRFASFGKESSDADRVAASAVLAENLKAREEGDFRKQCALLGSSGLIAVTGSGKKSAPECPKALKELAEPLASSKGLRKDTLAGSIAELRVDGEHAYALYHGTDGKAYAMPMEEEAGVWRVGAIVPFEF